MLNDGTLWHTGEPKAAKTILIAEDDAEIAWILFQFLRQHTSYAVIWAENGSVALKALRNTNPDLLVLDYKLPDMTGLALYDQVKAQAPVPIPAILVTANIARLQPEIGRRRLVALAKPFDLEKLLEAIEELIA